MTAGWTPETMAKAKRAAREVLSQVTDFRIPSNLPLDAAVEAAAVVLAGDGNLNRQFYETGVEHGREAADAGLRARVAGDGEVEWGILIPDVERPDGYGGTERIAARVLHGDMAEDYVRNTVSTDNSLGGGCKIVKRSRHIGPWEVTE